MLSTSHLIVLEELHACVIFQTQLTERLQVRSVADMTTRPVRIGLQLQPQHADYAAIRDTVRAAEDLGVDIIFNWDHFYPLSGEPNGKHFECWTMLGAWAEQTSRVEIGALVTCNSYRNPELLADMARTVDHLSGGRLILGIGAGWFRRDYDEYGYQFGTAGSRLNRLRDDLPRIESRWAKLNPAPTRKIPVLIGGGGEKKTLRITAQHADIWHSFSDVTTLKHKLRVLRGHCADLGRNPDEIEISTEVGRRDPASIGAPLHEAGARLFTIAQGGPDYDLTSLKRWINWRDAQR
jgi:probable F420-dependent oxidoreductase